MLGVTVTAGLAPNAGGGASSDSSGRISNVSLGYSDARAEGVTRATIGHGIITVDGDIITPTDLNRDITRAQEITKNESTQFNLSIPTELLTDPVT